MVCLSRARLKRKHIVYMFYTHTFSACLGSGFICDFSCGAQQLCTWNHPDGFLQMETKYLYFAVFPVGLVIRDNYLCNENKYQMLYFKK